ncbi:MAG TPA: hypothetical protein VHS76_03965 [Steroidobacteraceae bacterium]|nr:hypothetical protein [Steroidobacteraceae bacterium]
MKRLLSMTTLLCTAAAAHAGPATCTAGQLDTAYGGAANAGYVQISPVLYGESEFEGGVIDSSEAYYALSSAAVDYLGNPVVDIIKVKAGGARDLTFGGFGNVVPVPPTTAMSDAQLAIDPAGNTIAATLSADLSNIVLTRYLPSGVLDTSFGTSGQLTIQFPGYANAPFNVKAGADGSLYIAAASYNPNPPWQPVVVKTTPAGTLDSSFGIGGFAFFYADNFGPLGKATDLTVNADGTILVAGRVGDNSTMDQFFVARLLSSGVLDSSFGTSSGMTVVGFGSNTLAYGRKMGVQADGKIVVVGGLASPSNVGVVIATGVIRLKANGVPDPGFNGTGSAQFTSLIGQLMALQDNNKILIAGTDPTSTTTAVLRLLVNGAPDPAFGSSANGLAALPVPNWPVSGATHVNYNPNGKIIVHIGAAQASGVSNGAGYLARLDSGSGAGCH